MSLKIDKDRSNIDVDIRIGFDIETMGANEALIDYYKKQITDSIDKHIIKQLTDMSVQIDHRPKNLSLTDTIDFDRYAFPSYVSIDYTDNKTPLIPIVL